MQGLLHSALGPRMRIEIRQEAELWPAMIDPTQFELVILNLVINARDAMPRGGIVTIETANTHRGPPRHADEPAEGDYVIVMVRDTGVGMSPEVQARAFEPFFTTKPPGAGSGLGLSQVFGTARQSGGGVQIDSTPGKGTAVSVYLPRAAGTSRIHFSCSRGGDRGKGGRSRCSRCRRRSGSARDHRRDPEGYRLLGAAGRERRCSHWGC